MVVSRGGATGIALEQGAPRCRRSRRSPRRRNGAEAVDFPAGGDAVHAGRETNLLHVPEMKTQFRVKRRDGTSSMARRRTANLAV